MARLARLMRLVLFGCAGKTKKACAGVLAVMVGGFVW